MSFNRTIKSAARQSLRGNWGTAIGLLFTFSISSYLLSLLEEGLRTLVGIPEYMGKIYNLSLSSALIFLLSVLLSISILIPLFQSVIRWFYNCGAGRFHNSDGGSSGGYSEGFHYFESTKLYSKCIGLNLLANIKIFLWSILLAVPMIAVLVVLVFMSTGSFTGMTSFVVLLVLIWIALLTIFETFITMRYFLAPYLLVDESDAKVGDLIRKSIHLMRGHKGRLFMLNLSFWPWFLPTILALACGLWSLTMPGMFITVSIVLGLLLIQLGLIIYVGPYLQMTSALFARHMIECARAGQQPFTGQPPATDGATNQVFPPYGSGGMSEPFWEPSTDETREFPYPPPDDQDPPR